MANGFPLCCGGIVSLETHFFTPRKGDFSGWGEKDTRVKEWLTHYFIEMETKAWERVMALKARARAQGFELFFMVVVASSF